MNTNNKGKIWTLKDEYLLIELALTNRPILEIARVLGRSPKACSARIHKLLPKSGKDKPKLVEYLICIPVVIYDYLFVVYLRRKNLNKKINRQ